MSDYPDDTAAFYIENPDGSTRRVAGDEVSLPLKDYELNSALPGGFTTADGDAVLPENGLVDFSKFSRCSVKLNDGTELWSGRVEGTPIRTDDGTLRLSCAGHQAQIVDTDGITFLGVSSDMSLWEEPPRSYIESVNTTNAINTAYEVSTGEEGITISMDSDRNVQATARGEVWFRAPAGQVVAEIQYIGSDSGESNMTPTLRVLDDPDGATVDTESLTASLDLNVHSWEPVPHAQYAVLRDTASTQVNKTARVVAMHAISIYGDHDINRQPIEGLPDGLLFSDIAAYLVPLLTGFRVVVGGESTIEPSNFVLANAAWLESTSLAQILEDGMTYEAGRTWALWGGQEFHYGRRDNMGRLWSADRADGARFIDSGETAEPNYNGVVVVYTDHDGHQRTAGPPGWFGYDEEDSVLLDDDPDNPVTVAGLRRPYVVDIGEAKADRALEYGEIALNEVTQRRFTGDIELPRYAQCDGQTLPTSMIRADDRILDSLTGEELPLREASYARSRADRPFSGRVEDDVNRVDAALARAGAKPQRVRRGRIRHRYRKAHRRRTRKKNDR